MSDLPIPSASPLPAAAARPTTNSAQRSDGARDTDAQGEKDPFQALLAQELENAAGPTRPPAKVPLAALPIDSQTAPDAPAQIGATGDAAVLPFYVGMMPLPPPAAAAVDADWSAASTRRGRVLDAIQGRPGSNANVAVTAMATADPRLPAASASAERDAAELAAPGKLLPAAGAEITRDFKLAPALLDQPKTAPAAMSSLPAHHLMPAPAAALTATIAEARVGQHGWDQALGDKLVWMAGQSHQVAQLHLNPPELGPLEIMLTLNNDQASAQFVSAHAAVREAIESAMPRLREMLAESGITLGNASVGADTFRDQAPSQRQNEPRAFTPRPALATIDTGPLLRGSQSLRLSQGLVDTFA